MSKVKICGLRREEDIEAVNRTLPDFIGFVFAPSRRMVDIKTASALREKLDPRIKAVGVFVDEDIGAVSKIYKNGIIDLVQLHGGEDERYIVRLKEACGCQVIKSAGIGDMMPSLPAGPDYLLFDTLSSQHGGTGRTFDWNILKGYCGLPYFLAGGLSIENAAAAIDFLSPFCVDVSTGVEKDGAKDAKKIEIFISLVRGIKE
jgi:phosphoribosylanthranilate isomerase